MFYHKFLLLNLLFLIKRINLSKIFSIPLFKSQSSNLNDFSEYIDIDIYTNIKFGNNSENISLTITFEMQSLIIQKQFKPKSSILLNYIGTILYRNKYFQSQVNQDKIYLQITNLKNNTGINEELKIEKYIYQNIDNDIFIKKKKKNFFGLHSLIIISGYNDNFVMQLKKKNLINSYDFTIEFTDDNNGKLILGGMPHEYDVSNYDEKYFVKENNINTDWHLNFYNISHEKNEEIIFENKGILSLSYYGLVSTFSYQKMIDNIFFNKYFEDSKCEKKINIGEENVTIYICDNDINVKKFPKLLLFNKLLNFTFIFEGKELFRKFSKDKIIFLIHFGQEIDKWKLGQIFLKKYQLIYNYDKKIIGLYTQKKNMEFPLYFINYIIYLILIIIIIILTVFLIKNRKKVFRKIRANELEDTYDYTPAQKLI